MGDPSSRIWFFLKPTPGQECKSNLTLDLSFELENFSPAGVQRGRTTNTGFFDASAGTIKIDIEIEGDNSR